MVPDVRMRPVFFKDLELFAKLCWIRRSMGSFGIVGDGN
jgi:hypothetical protein